ncbi:helix-turn-helix domain-containing protein [Holophaga foetida]|uniref:helix-turn-helix domain-containing protein n=1 Tax=Holophaga foetida TaxID=35839 RepID=UPI0002473746|nr:helix-turn-helix transcriptional regulator [Holophaga foetida]
MKPQTRPPRRRAPKNPQTPGQRIWAARERLGFTQRSLGLRLGVGQAAVSAWEKDVTQPRESAWPLLVEVLGLSQHTLETGEGYDLAGLPYRACETSTPYGLPPLPDGVEVIWVPAGGNVEGVTAPEAARCIQEAVQDGRPVWVVVG